MSLDRLRTFLHVYREGSMGRAAKALGLTQPGVSAQIKALEHELGAPLFDRRSQGVVPTDAANGLARDVAAGIDRLEQSVARRVARTTDIAGSLHIGAPPELFSVYGPVLMTALDHPGLDIRVRLGNRSALHGGLSDGSLDLAVTASRPKNASFGAKRIGAEKLQLIGQADGPLIAYDDDLSLVAEWFAAHRPDDNPPRPKLIVGDLRSVRDLVVALRGWSVLPAYLTTALRIEDRLAVIDRRTVDNPFYLVWKRSRLRTPRIAYARDALAATELGETAIRAAGSIP
ncbi:LysR family transcriptional regulator [uncultured Algimonas sp.]|uniref:LysR family transcriptional regulator n=1 Tax=uncultured Algimonas sp. TaxID=1547920 RepID=UPI002617E3E9|nr:LysR family transcriptional regulator [uncultured Algimonas sp.]